MYGVVKQEVIQKMERAVLGSSVFTRTLSLSDL